MAKLRLANLWLNKMWNGIFILSFAAYFYGNSKNELMQCAPRLIFTPLTKGERKIGTSKLQHEVINYKM